MHAKLKRIVTNGRIIWLALAILAIMISLYTLQMSSANARDITVYKSPTCGCGNKWISHLEENNFKVTAHDRSDMSAVKQQFRIKPTQQSCHTALINGYTIEGHVPAADIKRLLTEKPNIRGLSVPGMPMGSPGMEGPRKNAYQVLAIDRQGNTSVFTQH